LACLMLPLVTFQYRPRPEVGEVMTYNRSAAERRKAMRAG
jgi:hypothetical protein